jgi:ADP-ribose pyrophosphatase YjhB (NUDIX family)
MVYRPPVEQVHFQRMRVAVIVIQDDNVLLVAHQFPQQRRAWLLPGGSVELGETFIEAALRETREETGLKVEIEKLIFWREFFDWRYALELTFLARPTGGQLRVGHDPEFHDHDQIIKQVKWFPLNDLSEVDIAPQVLGQRLSDAWRAGFEGHQAYLGLTESFAEALRAWQPGSPPDRLTQPRTNMPGGKKDDRSA